MIKSFSLENSSGPSPVSQRPDALHDARVMPMLPPMRAWRILCARTGGSIALVTFYRWLRNGRIYSIRMGQRIFIPQPALEDAIKQCLAGERF
jgi:hypothetical protein